MCLGALVDAGVSLERLRKGLNKIPIRGYELRAKRVKRAGFAATKVDVIQRAKSSPPQAEQRAKIWEDIEKIIHKSSFAEKVKRRGLSIFERLFRAEAKVHGESFEKVHLHELGAIDCIIDVFGTIIGLEMLGVEKVYSSPVNLGGGSVKVRHGILPVPAPATSEILKGISVYSSDMPFELTTPTGAALLKGLSSGFGSIPSMTIEKIGIGAGSKNFKDRPNVLRLFVGEELAESSRGGEEAIVIEANIDDMNPQVYEYVMERLFNTGALDVFLTQVLMKKGRPGIKLTVLCDEAKRERLINLILKETTTIGLRFYTVKRRVLRREIKKVHTDFGKVRVKFSKLGNEMVKATPEYEDCKRIAKKLNIPLIEVLKRVQGLEVSRVRAKN